MAGGQKEQRAKIKEKSKRTFTGALSQRGTQRPFLFYLLSSLFTKEQPR
jgi:hypothetical protein